MSYLSKPKTVSGHKNAIIFNIIKNGNKKSINKVTKMFSNPAAENRKPLLRSRL